MKSPQWPTPIVRFYSKGTIEITQASQNSSIFSSPIEHSGLLATNIVQLLQIVLIAPHVQSTRKWSRRIGLVRMTVHYRFDLV
jgi:hypothetical protein